MSSSEAGASAADAVPQPVSKAPTDAPKASAWKAIKGIKKISDDLRVEHDKGLGEVPVETASFGDMLKFVSKSQRQWNQLIEMFLAFLFVISFFIITQFINNISVAFSTIQYTKFLILADRPDELELGDTSKLDLPHPAYSMWNVNDNGALRSRRRRLRGVGSDDDEGNFFHQEMTDERQVWKFLSNKLGEALLSEVPLQKCRTGLCDDQPVYKEGNHRHILQVGSLWMPWRLELGGVAGRGGVRRRGVEAG